MRMTRTIVTIMMLSGASSAWAYELYVDNVNGSDAFDGSAPTIRTTLSGPLRTLARAAESLQPGDSVVLTNNGRPYFESLNFAGRRFSGASTRPLLIQGNGAQLCGVRVLPIAAWQSAGTSRWQLNFSRKGWGRLFRDGAAFPEHVAVAGENLRDALPVGYWGQQRGLVHVHHEAGRLPSESEWTYAAVDIGISLVDVNFVEISNLEIWGFRVDGINVDSHSRDIVLKNVTVRDNGRAGVAVGSSSKVALEGCKLHDNGRYSMIITEAAGARADDATDFGGVDPAVTVITR